jgi:hypothetical protein
MRPDRKADDVPLRPATAYEVVAPRPCSTVALHPFVKQPAAVVSLMGIFQLAIPLANDLSGLDVAWVSDPLEPSRSCSGSLAEVIGMRTGVLPGSP